MNIFILSGHRTWIAHMNEQVQSLCDRHIVKMIAEGAQMLVTAAPEVGVDLYRVTEPAPCAPLSANMAKHPCTRWTAYSSINYSYLAHLTLAMCHEHQHRYPLSAQHQYMPWLKALCARLEEMGCGISLAALPTHFAVAVKDKEKRSTAVKHSEAVAIYRDYYVRDKHKFATWKRRAKPLWFIMREEELIAKGKL